METGTSSRPSSGPSYEVFLNFRGADTRNTFTDFLYRDMVTAGITVFRDNESLRVGQEIGGELLQAIENSHIYIPIFSKRYASSCWCLRELAHMVEYTSKSNGSKEILPIFLGVEPADVKLKTNWYERNLLKRQKKSSSSEEKSWKKALKKVAKIKGWTWTKDESQVDLIQSIVQTVVAKLNVRSKILVSEHLVGVDDQVQDIIEKLDVGSDGVRFLGIHGMGGIGKTTLAKVVFNQLSSHFKDCHFLLDVGESSRRHGMKDLQKQLLLKFSPISVQIDNEDDGINKIKRVLFNKKVLIVLDDVDEKKQLKSLAGKGSWFGSGSRIIITTRDQSVLTTEEEVMDKGSVEKSTNVLTHEVREMEFDHALKLFSRHAFRRDYPQDPYVSLSEKVVSKLGKLPLALEIIGSSLSNKSKALWVETLEKLKKAPPGNVQSKLIISYERLDHSQKQVFLDIACFFVGKDKTYPCYMWDACEYYPHNALETLFLKSLIKIKDDNTFWMHDQVRDLGRDIVLRENFDDPYERSRVWNHEEGLHILNQKEANQKIKALSLGFKHEDINLNLADFPKLRLFQAYGSSLLGDLNNPLYSLTWLSCHCCHIDFGPNKSCPPNLVVLDLSNCSFSEEGIGWIMAAKKLKVLNLNDCPNLVRTPLPGRVHGLPTTIRTPTEVKLLKLDCILVRFFPHLPSSLRELRLEDLAITQSPDFSNLKNLSTLDFQHCWMPEFSGIFDAELEELSMDYCIFTRLDALFQLEMKRLTSLKLVRCDFRPEVIDLSHMKNLQEVWLEDCKFLVEICGLEELGSLSSLTVEFCRSIERMSDLSKLRKLRELRIEQCPKLRSLGGLNHLESLERLWIRDCESLESLADTSNLDLLCLKIVRCEQLPSRPNYCKRGLYCGCRGLCQ